MADQFFPYIPDLVLATWGNIPIQGFADGTFITVEYDEAAVTKSVGVQGLVTATVNSNRAGKCTFTLSQASPTNTALSALAASNRKRGAPLIVKSFLLKDLNGLTVCSAEHAWIMKVPPSAYAKESGNREWTLDIASLSMTTAGSEAP